MSFSNTSRNLLTSVVEVRSVVTGEHVQPPFVDLRQRIRERAPDDRIIVYDTLDSWSGIAAKHMHDANAWWVIADLSDVIDPFAELVEGKELRAPSISRYMLEILPTSRGSF